MLEGKVSINLFDGKQIGINSDWPTICYPCSLNAGHGVTEIIVVIGGMMVAKV